MLYQVPISKAEVDGIQTWSKITSVNWGSFGQLAEIFQLLAPVTQLLVGRMISDDGGKLESGEATQFYLFKHH